MPEEALTSFTIRDAYR